MGCFGLGISWLGSFNCGNMLGQQEYENGEGNSGGIWKDVKEHHGTWKRMLGNIEGHMLKDTLEDIRNVKAIGVDRKEMF